MAFLGIDESGAAANVTGLKAASNIVGFSQLEWTVVGLARHDSPRSLGRSNILDRLLAMLLGGARDARLANPRLEVLRRTALAIRRWGYRLPGHILEAFDAAGFTRSQLDTLISTVEIEYFVRTNGRLA